MKVQHNLLIFLMTIQDVIHWCVWEVQDFKLTNKIVGQRKDAANVFQEDIYLDCF